MSLPVVQWEILETIREEVERNPEDWVNRACDKLETIQPVLAIYLSNVLELCGEHAVVTGLIIYKVLEAQLEVNELNEKYSEKIF